MITVLKRRFQKVALAFCGILASLCPLPTLSLITNPSETIFMPSTRIDRQIALPLAKEQTCIVFDIHSVLIKKNRLSMGWNLFKNVGLIKYTFHEKIKKHFESIDGRFASPEDYFMPLIKKIPDIEPYIPGLLEVVNAQDPIPGIPSLLSRLDYGGYKLYVLSNIGPAAYYGWQSTKDSQLKSVGLKDIYPEIFKYFTAAYIAAKKPSTQAYTGFLASCIRNQKNKKKPTIIFIDDKIENILAAVQQGLIGILFKDPNQLESDLKMLGITY